ncbi:amidohydrolase family protein [Reyranella sp.]|uniref:amidohydrolase family protein n=1 Tax=Reyranella sp. TaxID=1929291 RepID=UPI003BAC388D
MPDPGGSAVFLNGRLDGGAAVDLMVDKGRIIAFDRNAASPGMASIDLDGGLVLPGLIDGHAHLDKSLVGDVWIDNDSSAVIQDRIDHELRVESLARLPLAQRAANLVELAITHGTTRIRTHVDVESRYGIGRVEAIAGVRERYRDAIDIEIVAFPQLGVVSRPGTVALLDAALDAGADLLGGIDPAGVDHDVKGQLDVLFGLAAKRGVALDFHLHDQGSLGLHQLERIAERAAAQSMQGRVAISHAHCLGTVDPALLQPVIDKLAAGGVSIMTFGPGAVAMPPIKRLREAGVTVFSGNDNIRDPWTPFGNADMLERAMIVAYRSGYRSDGDLRIAFDLATVAAAKATGAADYGLWPGAWADFSVVAAASFPEAVVARPVRDCVVKRGKVVARGGRLVGR